MELNNDQSLALGKKASLAKKQASRYFFTPTIAFFGFLFRTRSVKSNSINIEFVTLNKMKKDYLNIFF
ncbi:uncharacterized protein METZ01_LOCUS144539 [marine metagenome]|uniref:Uncharacterized protein n=1 Tax=marine metagenome TaxID=408172 RepID=A0A381ZQY3_9ZZZZ